ncbi:hypothetical protein [Oryzibacter oryziterrae]|uniref:hypothetical protein n=1 Tax=Oryzibacter oryziterrae TaxID=2766474 RepID=UPI001F3149E4|nr:hypothetical protein [Oryzibacter oryziterrae]
MKTSADAFFERLNGFLSHWYERIYAVATFVLGVAIAWHVLTLITDLPTWEILALVICMAGLAIGLWMRGGESRAFNAFGTIAVYFGGFAAALALFDAFSGNGATVQEWQAWLIFTAIFVLAYRGVVLWLHPARKLEGMTEEEREEYLAARLASARHKAELKQLPSNGWYEIASFVTGAAMVGSFATTAIGFYHEIVDPLDTPLVRFGVPIGLSALAALIIWAGWNFVFLRIRLASNMISRLFGYMVGFVVLVPMTLAIHTVFGIIGVGGTEGIRAHNLWYTDVLDAYERRVDGIRAIEANRLEGALSYMSNQLKSAADNEEKTGQGCGAGKGSLWTFYTDSAARTGTILDVVNTRKNANLDIKADIEALRARIRNPERKLEELQPDLAAQADVIRKKIMETDNSSALPSVATFVKETRATVNSDAFFSGWSSCTIAKKDVILTQINTLIDSVEEAATTAETDIEAKKNSPEFAIPVETRIESISFIDRLFHGEDAVPNSAVRLTNANDVPVFVPLRPFWAVVSYAGSLMGYVALQLALDFSPAVLGLLFTLLAPFPRRRTVLGKAWDRYWEQRSAKWFPDEPAPVAPAAAVVVPAAAAVAASEVADDWHEGAPEPVEEPVAEPSPLVTPEPTVQARQAASHPVEPVAPVPPREIVAPAEPEETYESSRLDVVPAYPTLSGRAPSVELTPDVEDSEEDADDRREPTFGSDAQEEEPGSAPVIRVDMVDDGQDEPVPDNGRKEPRF